MRLNRWLIVFVLVFGSVNTRAQIPIPNNDFENWVEPGSYDDHPIGWITNNGQWSCSFVEQDTSAYHGNLSMKLMNYDTLPNCHPYARTKFAISSHPLNLYAFQKSNLINSDTVSIEVKLFFNNAVVDSGQWLGTTSASVFTLINIPISQNQIAVDTATIKVLGGNHMINNQPTEFWVDYLFFDSVPATIDEVIDNEFELFPNPAAEKFQLNIMNHNRVMRSISLIDVLGHPVWQILNTNESKFSIDLTGYPKGMYFVKVMQENKSCIKKLVHF